MDDMDYLFGPVISAYTVRQAVADGELVEVFKNRWSELAGGKPLVATKHIMAEFSMAALQGIWNEFVFWRRVKKPTLKEEDRLFSTTKNDRKVWVLEDDESYTILFPEDY